MKTIIEHKGANNMIHKSDESVELFRELSRRGFALEFCELISRMLNTTWTANRMLGYLKYLPQLREEDIVDEMIGILEHREQIRKKKEAEFYQSKLNEMYYYGFEEDDFIE